MATSTLTPRGTSARGTTIALKTVMALTGVLFVLFVIAHMYGNLKIFSGPAAFDDYAKYLRTIGEPLLPYGGFLWITRIVLLVSVVGHAASAFALWRRAEKARGTRYVVKKAAHSTLSSRTMRWGGVALLLFIVFHILHFTTNTIQLNGDYASPGERYLTSFELWWAVLIYTVAVVALGLHLRHGIGAAAMTLGVMNKPRSRAIWGLIGLVVAVVVVVGYLVPPFAVLFGLID